MNALHFDTNALIALPAWARENHALISQIERGAPVRVCAMAWFEFLCGPVSETHLKLVSAVVSQSILPVTESLARSAAGLFNAIGRSRKLRTDTLIAACAIADGASLVTLNLEDFQVFVPHGLRLAPI